MKQDQNDHRELYGTPKEGTYTLIYADPPWRLHQTGARGAIQKYDLMYDEQILGMGEAIQHISAKESWLALWVTNATLELGIDVMTAWGFRRTDLYFWAKTRMTTGHRFRNAGELLLVGVRGNPVPAFRGQWNWGVHALQDHSHKPEEIQVLLERFVGGTGPFLELFARREPASMNNGRYWDCWGLEVASTISLAHWGYPVPSDFDQQHVAAEPLE